MGLRLRRHDAGAATAPGGAELGRRAAEAGLSGLVVTEAGRTAYLTCGALAVAADIDILTGIAVAFPRSPMVTASTAWELAEASGGRFRLGLGAQVRAHIERRYGAEFDPPGPRLREYVLAVKQIFTRLPHRRAARRRRASTTRCRCCRRCGRPARSTVADPPDRRGRSQPLDAAHGRRGGRRRARPPAQHADVPRARPCCPSSASARRGRDGSVDDLEVIVPAFLCVGDTEEERSRWREMARVQVAFYGSTPNYAFIFEQLDREGTTERDPGAPARRRHRRAWRR